MSVYQTLLFVLSRLDLDFNGWQQKVESGLHLCTDPAM